jgi:hypothetical protein
MENKNIIRAADYLPEPNSGSGGNGDFELPISEQLLLTLFGTSPDYNNQKFEDIWQEVMDAEDEDMIAYCLSRGVDVTVGGGEEVPGWRDIAVMLKAIDRGLIEKKVRETP